MPETVNSLKLEEVEMILETPKVTELPVETPNVEEESGVESTPKENEQEPSEELPDNDFKL